MPPELPFALLAGAVLGASAHRAGLCTVKAVAEVMTSRRGHILLSFLKASLWTAGILAVAAWLGANPALSARPTGALALAGGIVFGLGAGMNGACSISTLARLAEGHSVMLFTLAGWAMGLTAVAAVWPGLHPVAAATSAPVWLALPLLVWMLWEGGRLLRRLLREGRALLGPHWPLSLAVAILALANAALILMGRPWSVKATALCATHAAPLAVCQQMGGLWLISGAAVAAMVLSAWLRGSFRLRRIRAVAALRHLAAGTAMGAGAAFIPGGNDGLILFGLPALSPHAPLALGGIVLGIWLTLIAMRLLGRPIPQIRCDGDYCKASL